MKKFSQFQLNFFLWFTLTSRLYSEIKKNTVVKRNNERTHWLCKFTAVIVSLLKIFW